MTEKQKILLVEDDVSLAEWISDYLQSKGFDVAVTHRGDQARAAVDNECPDLILLDGMLPGLDGFEVCKALRPSFKKPIIMLTARDEDIDEVLGLELGADDYLKKPVRARVLLARIQLQLRRFQAVLSTEQINPSDAQRLQIDGLIIDKQAHLVSLNGNKIKLSSNEFDVLWLLAKAAGQVVSREKLTSELRGFEYDGFDRSIDLRISRLRKKLDDSSDEPTRIKTIWGKGYLLARDAW